MGSYVIAFGSHLNNY